MCFYVWRWFKKAGNGKSKKEVFKFQDQEKEVS